MKSKLHWTVSALIALSFLLMSCQSSSLQPPETRQPPTATSSPTIIPSPTPSPFVFLSELKPTSSVVGHGYLGVGVYPFSESPAVEGQPIYAHSTQYRHGLFAHAPSTVEYVLDGQYSKFTAYILMQDGVNCGDGVVFRVELDDRLAYESQPVHADTAPQKIEVDVSSAQLLELVVNSRSSGDCDWSIWGDPVLTKADQRSLKTPTPDPNLPCGGVMPERVYLFLDCSDIRRIREELKTREVTFIAMWYADKQIVDRYRANFPTAYDQNNTANVLWWGSGNFMAEDMALIYLVTGDHAYADDVRRLLDLIKNNTHYSSHLSGCGKTSGGLFSNPGNGNMPFQSVLFAYLSIRDTDSFTDQERQEFDDFFIQQGFLAYEYSACRGGRIPLDSTLNRNVVHAAAIVAATMAVAFQDNPRAQALYQTVMPELDWQIANFWQPDGGWGEDTEGYGFERMEGLLILAEAIQKNMGIDMYKIDYGGKNLGTLCRHYLQIVTPEGMSPAMNDTPHYYMDPGILRLCANRTNDSQLAYAADYYDWGRSFAYGRRAMYTVIGEIAWSGLPPKPQSPDFTSLALPNTGLAILRSGWEHTASYLLVQFTASKVHEEKSYGAIYLYDGGPWMVGNGYHGKEFFGQEGQSTWQHTTLAMDNISQAATGGTLQAFADLDQTGIISVKGTPYPNMIHTRSVLWIKPWHQWLVLDDARILDGKPHSLQLRWYVRGNVENNQDNVWQFSRESGSPKTLTISMYPQGQASYKKAERHYAWEEWVNDAVGVEMDTTTSGDLTRLVSSLNSAVSVPIVERSDEKQGTLLQSTLESASWEWIIPYPKTQPASIGPYTVNGQAGCVRLANQSMQGYCLMQGTDLASATQTLVQSPAPLSLEANIENGSITIEVDSETTLAFYWPIPISQILDGSQSVSYQVNQGLIQVMLLSGRHVLTIK